MDGVTPVVLAGGGSRRFGEGDKAVARLRGRPLVAHVVDALAAAVPTPPIVAVGSAAQRDRVADAVDSVRFVRDGEAAPEGPVAGLTAAARRVRRDDGEPGGADWLLAVPCDAPLLSPNAVDWLCGLPRDDVDAVVPVVGGETQPLFALYRTRALLDAVRDDPPSSLRGVVDVVDGAERARPRGATGDAVVRAVRDVDTVEELERLHRDRATTEPER